MEKQSKSGRKYGLSGLVILFFFSAGLLGAQSVELVLEGDRFAQGDRLTFEIRVAEEDPTKVVFPPPVLPSALTLLAGPFQKPSGWTDSTGRAVMGTVASFQARVVSDGIVTLGPFTLRVGGREVLSPSRTLFLLKADETGRRFPLEQRWSVPPGPYYEGQAISLVLLLDNLEYIPSLEGVSLPVPGNALLERSGNSGGISIRQLGDDTLYAVPYDSWLLIPVRPGTVQLNPVSYTVAGLKRSTPSLRLEVLALPEGVKKSRAVGNFEYSAGVRQKSVELGTEVVVIQELKGRGNFPYLVLPEIQSPGLQLLSREPENDYVPGPDGYDGVLRVVSRFAPQKPGVETINLPAFLWFDRGQVYQTSERIQEIEVRPRASSPSGQSEDLLPLSWESINDRKPWELSRNPLVFLGLIPGMAILLLFLFKKKTNLRKGLGVLAVLGLLGTTTPAQTPPPAFLRGMEAFEAKKWSVATELWGSLLKPGEINPGLLYNRALGFYKGGDNLRAIQHLRGALGTGQSFPEAELLLTKLETSSDLQDQWGASPWISPDWFVIAALVLANLFLAFLGATVLFKKKKSFTAVGVSGAGLILVAALWAGAVAYAEGQSGIVGTSVADLQRVPGNKAEKWMSLPGGTAIRVLGVTEAFALVQTGYGLEGWMKKDSLLWTDRDHFSR